MARESVFVEDDIEKLMRRVGAAKRRSSGFNKDDVDLAALGTHILRASINDDVNEISPAHLEKLYGPKADNEISPDHLEMLKEERNRRRYQFFP